MLWFVTAVIFMWTLRYVYQGGKEANDHVVAIFIFACMFVYPFLAFLHEKSSNTDVDNVYLQFVLVSGPLLMCALFWILSRRQDAGWRMLIAYLSQISFSFSLWVWGLFGLGLPILWLLNYPLWQPILVYLALALSTYGLFWVMLRRDQIRKIKIGTRGLRILQLSDIHVSPVMRRSDLDRIAIKVRALEPDVVVITGDLVMPFSEDAHDFLLDFLADLSVPVFCCMGNHDLPIQQQLIEELSAIDVKLLIDEQVFCRISDIDVEFLGLQFQWTDAVGHYNRVVGASSTKESDVRILLVHDPRYFHAVESERFDLMLSGHTHGGQFGLNMFGLPFSFFRPFGFLDQGIFKKQNLLAYVHKGNWHTGLPPRVGIAPEIVVFDL